MLLPLGGALMLGGSLLLVPQVANALADKIAGPDVEDASRVGGERPVRAAGAVFFLTGLVMLLQHVGFL